MMLGNLIPRLSTLLEEYPKKDIPGIAMGIMRIFGHDTVPKDFFEFDLYTENPTIHLNGEYINEWGKIIFPEENVCSP